MTLDYEKTKRTGFVAPLSSDYEDIGTIEETYLLLL